LYCDREDDGGRGVHPVAFRRSRREFIDERRARPRGEDPRVQSVRGAGVPCEAGGVGESRCGGEEGEVLRFVKKVIGNVFD
jgi:hypothetical protein